MLNINKYIRDVRRIINMTSHLSSWWLKNLYTVIRLRQMCEIEDLSSGLMSWLHFYSFKRLQLCWSERIMKSELSWSSCVIFYTSMNKLSLILAEVIMHIFSLVIRSYDIWFINKTWKKFFSIFYILIFSSS